MWKANGKTTLVIFLDNLSPKTYVSSCRMTLRKQEDTEI
jgi:hypothetical protein